jgi:DNA-directed RNA polymerase II subunit RPB2
MPFTKDGIIPDIIINPNAFPGRMTIGQMIECIVGKVAILQHYGEADGTPFNDISLDTIMNELENEGYPRDGTEELYNGMTGYKLKSKIFIGPTFYQRLRRFAFDNVHSRSRGSKTILTRQPPEGKIRNGGCRIGEMERDALLAHGCGNFMKEKFVDTSDAFCIQICDQCGLFAERMIRKDSKYYPTEDDIFWCRSCNNKSSISKIIVPYAFKLMLQELMSMNIAPRIKTNNIIE